MFDLAQSGKLQAMIFGAAKRLLYKLQLIRSGRQYKASLGMDYDCGSAPDGAACYA
jgi:hypothetical protein